MEGDSKEPPALDVKPLRTLTPLFPAPLGFNSFTPPNASPFVCVTPFGPFASGAEPTFPPNFSLLYPAYQTPQPTNQRPGDATANGSHHPKSRSTAFHTPPVAVAPLSQEDPFSGTTSASGRKIKQSVHLRGYQLDGSEAEGSEEKKVKSKKPKKLSPADRVVLPYSSQDARESVDVILMTFDALRRRLLQLDEVKDMNRRPDLKVGNIMMNNDLRVNTTKRIGPVPGVEVGDIFYFRIEMCLIGLHNQSMAGIDTMTAKFGNEDDTVAVGIVSAGGYDNEDDDVDALVYIGQGGSSSKKQMDDQKLERGNLALKRSFHRANEIRVIRSAKDFTCQNGKIYIYDGLYKVRESWVEKGKSGFNVFKFKLLREPGQPDGLAVWKMTEKWKENPASRGRVILPDISSGVESIPVCLVNDVDDEKGPSHFTYVTQVKHFNPINFMRPLQGCMCQSVCLPGDANCSCARQNGGDLPYSSSGLLVSRKPLIYECSASCSCSVNCRNRVSQKGVKIHFEVFRTKDRGWGLRSWDPIRAGTFVCEYTGEVIHKSRVDEDGEEDKYVFQAVADDKAFKWNYIPELLGEPSSVEPREVLKPLPIIISARNMGNIARFMNHSCSPNVFWQPVQHDHGDEGYPHIMFFAIKHIPPMTELTYDYGLSEAGIGAQGMWENGHQRTKRCLCGSSNCRGRFG